ncbi:Hypothetical protein, putative [Bodo saltans]|uniref:Pleckstrin homology domain-containing protein n=1 Tax=Bodo saltans TaxID=75058 RepID=A0A0S4ILC3_BODSA|nr:Hypothetical protein, putative [Bodo saltans]|eukprot:CUE70810.1 Hypothetical protein, putative [Bodo saltans]
MDDEHEQHLARILQNRRNRGVVVHSGAAVTTVSSSTSRFTSTNHIGSPQQQGSTIREPSPMARFPSSQQQQQQQQQFSTAPQSFSHAPMTSLGTVPSLSYGGPSSRSSSVLNAPMPPPPAFSQRPPPSMSDIPSMPPPPPQHYSSSAYVSGPTAAAYDNTVPGGTLLGSSGARSGSMVAVASSMPNTYATGPTSASSMRAPTVDALLRRGTFENFRTNPVFVSTNIRPYAASPQRAGGAPAAVVNTPAAPLSSKNANNASNQSLLVRSPKQQLQDFGSQRRPAEQPPRPRQDPNQHLYSVIPAGHGDEGRPLDPQHHSPPSMNAVAAATFSKPNPFRSQTFEDFCEAPHYDRNVANDIVVPQHQRQGERNQKGILAMSPQSNGAPPLYDPQQSIAVLSQGDWFLKWTRIESAHRRYVWLDLNRGVISWAKSRDSSFFLQKSVKLEDIMDLQPLCTVDEESGRSFYQVMIVSTERVLKIGTELRDKFDVWFDTLQRLCEAQRVYTNTFIGRHAASNRTKPPHDFARRPAGMADGTE